MASPVRTALYCSVVLLLPARPTPCYAAAPLRCCPGAAAGSPAAAKRQQLVWFRPCPHPHSNRQPARHVAGPDAHQDARRPPAPQGQVRGVARLGWGGRSSACGRLGRRAARRRQGAPPGLAPPSACLTWSSAQHRANPPAPRPPCALAAPNCTSGCRRWAPRLRRPSAGTCVHCGAACRRAWGRRSLLAWLPAVASLWAHDACVCWATEEGTAAPPH